MIDLEEVAREGSMSLAEAAALIGAVTGVRPRTVQVWRWASKGLRNGARLEAFQLGRKWLTTKPAVMRFLHGYRPEQDGGSVVSGPVVAAAPRCPLPASPPSADARRRQIDEARARLSGIGLHLILV